MRAKRISFQYFEKPGVLLHPVEAQLNSSLYVHQLGLQGSLEDETVDPDHPFDPTDSLQTEHETEDRIRAGLSVLLGLKFGYLN